ncbi:GGDEF domain-containing response regulator [Seleniivibrio woodruffii]|uniref:diguanylate cyclase n=1 Tax=Seleniivibrio woodruffii TaxID=1078050 RepID=A0A4R1K2R9_9BACT|nr:diguanylate cyclase [Seleniivibrio woodruffii]TCK58335.1 diguanylate cyclase (GGDEF)-like protein [Seleniivibrio woodruffii]TVZ36709.1 diguanylate cyclase (GGDEF)-like protein [Seleniivibrio woodruffii]
MQDDRFLHISILYVEDEPAIREGLQRFFQRRSGTIYLAANGQEGLELFEKHRPDIVVTDIRMPVMDGLTMSRKIKELSPDIPIVITTGHNDEEFLLKAIDVGVDKYIKKPVDFRDLMKVILNLSSAVLYRRQLEQQNKFLREVMDLNPNFLATTDGSTCTYINDSFLSFLRCTGLEDFRLRYGSLENVFVTKDDSFYAGKNISEWIATAADDRQTSRIVVMKPDSGAEDDETTFILTVRHVPGKREYLLSFADVTHLEMEKQLYMILSMQDPLTKVYNRKKFFDELEKEVERVQRYQQKLSLIMMDADYFKNINDIYGHSVGDKVLINLTDLIRKGIRKTDILARYGGEEFAVLMPGTDVEGAFEIADRLRNSIASYDFPVCKEVTCSFGVAEFAETDTIDSFVQKADIALYEAKSKGRNNAQVFEGGSFKCSM